MRITTGQQFSKSNDSMCQLTKRTFHQYAINCHIYTPGQHVAHAPLCKFVFKFTTWLCDAVQCCAVHTFGPISVKLKHLANFGKIQKQ